MTTSSEAPEGDPSLTNPPEEPPGATPGESRRARHRARRAARTRRRRWLTRGGISVALLVVIVVGGVAGYTVLRLNQFKRVPGKHLSKVSGPTENILLIGSTDRCSATEIKQFAVQCETGVNGINSDVVLVMHLDPSTGAVSLLSIPRDTFVPDARAGGLYNKVDAALVDGPDQLTAAIEQDFGITINHFVEVNFETFEDVVNSLGGLYMWFPDRLVDASSGLDVHHTGCIYFDGQEALELVRSRHLYWFTKGETPNLPAIQEATNLGTYYTPDSGGQYDGSGDLGRITRVHLFLKALARQLKQKGLGNPLFDNSLIGDIASNFTIDSTFGDREILHLALDFAHINVGDVPTLTAPIIGDGNTYFYKGYNYGDVVFPAEPQDQQAIDQFLGGTPPGLKLAPSSISVSVVDGTQSPTGTAKVASALGALGYHMVATSASLYVGPVAETTVEYAPGHLQQAERVMSSLAGTVVLGEVTPTAGADITVVAGSDLAVAHPATTSAHRAPGTAVLTAASSVTTTTLATPDANNPNFSAPTSANPPPAHYDPRSCPVNAKKIK